MEILLTGGTGFVGSAVRQQVAAAGHHVRLLVRRDRRRPLPQTLPSSIEPREADLWSDPELKRAMRGADAVIHLIGIISEVGAETFERVHHQLTERFISTAQAENVGRFIHMSALGTRPGAVSRYHQSKWAAEETVRKSPLRWTIFRPSLIYGAGDAFTRLFARISAWSPVLPVMGSGDNLLQPIAVEQVAQAFAAAVDDVGSQGQTYDLCGPERMSFNEALRCILSVLGRRRGLLHIPWPLARCQAAFLNAVYPRILRRPAPLNPDQLLMLLEDNVGHGTPADREFALRHPSFKEGLRRYLAPADP